MIEYYTKIFSDGFKVITKDGVEITPRVWSGFEPGEVTYLLQSETAGLHKENERLQQRVAELEAENKRLKLHGDALLDFETVITEQDITDATRDAIVQESRRMDAKDRRIAELEGLLDRYRDAVPTAAARLKPTQAGSSLDLESK